MENKEKGFSMQTVFCCKFGIIGKNLYLEIKNINTQFTIIIDFFQTWE